MTGGLIEHLKNGQSILMDGALGTELERRGVPVEENGWSALAVRDHGEVVQQIHEDYLGAGAKLHIVNSFALAPHVLARIGLEDQFAGLNQRSVQLFDQAVSASGIERQSLWIAGSLSTFSAGSDRSSLPSCEMLVCNFRDQAEVLVAAGVDLFALEMLFDVEVTRAMLEAIRGFGLPVILGFTCDWSLSEDKPVPVARGLDGTRRPLEEILREVLVTTEDENLIVSVMHSELDVTDAALQVVHKCWKGPVAVYPNSGTFSNLRMNFSSVCNAHAFTEKAIGWIESGVEIVGGCCGIGPDHIARLGMEITNKRFGPDRL